MRFSRRREAKKSLPGHQRGGGEDALRCCEPPPYLGRDTVRRAEELLQPVVAQPPCKIPQPEHMFEELVHGGFPWRVIAVIVRSCASAASGSSLEQKTSSNSAPAEPDEATCSASFQAGGAGPLLAPLGGTVARVAASGCSEHACVLGSPPRLRKRGRVGGGWTRRRAVPSGCGAQVAPM